MRKRHIAAVGYQCEHPGVADQDVGLQVGHTAGGRGGNNGVEQVGPQPASPAGGHRKSEVAITVRQEGVASLGHEPVLGAGDDRHQAVAALLRGPGHLLKELPARRGHAEEAEVPVILGELPEQRFQTIDVGVRHGPHGQDPAVGEAQHVQDLTSNVSA